MYTLYEPAEDSYLLKKTLEEKIPKFLSKSPNFKFLEIGCGSGIQLEAAFKLGIKKDNILSCDIDPSAVKKCKALGFNCIKSDIFEKIKGKFDLIIFNPPYLPENKFDKEKDTTGGKNGSEIINRFLIQSRSHLTPIGNILILTSSLTKGIKWLNFKKKLLAKQKLFFEELYVYELSL
jgi:release factor glutamine methyltransferase